MYNLDESIIGENFITTLHHVKIELRDEKLNEIELNYHRIHLLKIF